MTPRPLCRRCVLPESPPDITLDDSGLCSVCAAHDRRPPAADAPPLETDFSRILEQNRGRGEYDCMVMCSGGKDSTAALYYMKRRYKAKVLAFNFDHGFETEEALANVRGAVAALDVDFLSFRSESMRPVFARLLNTGSRAVLCHICSIWYMDLSVRMAARVGIPLIVAGWTKGQSTRQPVLSKCACSANEAEFASMARATREFLARHVHPDPAFRDFPGSMEEVLARAKKRQRCTVVSPHWFLPYGSEVYVPVIEKELGWKAPRVSYPAGTTNCLLNFLSVRDSLRDYGYTHYHVEMSKLIRQGLMTREEALAQLQVNFGPELLERVTAKLLAGPAPAPGSP